MKTWYWLARLLMSVLLLGMVGLGLVASLPSQTSLAAGTPNNLFTWGWNVRGQLGDGTTTNHNTPEQISLPNGAAPTALAGGNAHSLAIGSDSKLYTWGDNTYGQLGDGSTTPRNTTPQPISLPNGATPTTIAAGYAHSLAISSNGKLYAWGYNSNGQLGNSDNTYTDCNTPQLINLPNGVVPTALAAGFSHSLAIGSDGNLYAWGLNYYGQLGDTTTTQRNSPVKVALPNGVTPTAIAAGWLHSLAIGSDGKLYAWGDNQYGELGDGTTTNESIPEQISLPNGVTPTAITAGNRRSLAIGSDGKLYTWGDNTYGQLGDGSTIQRNTPTPVSLPNGAIPTAIVSGQEHSLAIGSDGNLYAWGVNWNGQVGNGSGANQLSPILISRITPIAIAAGSGHNLVIVPPPSITINNVTQNEGNSGTTPFQFTVSLSYATIQTVTVQYATADNTATAADNDYQPSTGTLTIQPSQITGTITIQVNGDTRFERDETFTLALTNPTGTTLGTPSTGTGTILNDDICNALLVTSNRDDGSCGTLRYAVLHAALPPLNSKPKTIVIDLTAGTTISLTSGLTLHNAASITTTAQCGVGVGNTMLPPIIIQGVGTSSGNGLTLSGHNSLYGLWVRGFSGVQIKAPPGSTTKMQCVRASKL